MICQSENSIPERHPDDGNWITVHPDTMYENDNSRSHDIWQDRSHFQVKSMPLYYLENYPDSYASFSSYTLEELKTKIDDFAAQHKIIFAIIEDDLKLLKDYVTALLNGFTLYSPTDGGRTLHDAKAGLIPGFSRLLTFGEYSPSWIWKLTMSNGGQKLYYCPVVINTMTSTAGASPGFLDVNYIFQDYPVTGNVARSGHMYRAKPIDNNNLALNGGGNVEADRFTLYRIIPPR